MADKDKIKEIKKADLEKKKLLKDKKLIKK